MKFVASTALKRASAGAALTVALLSATGCGYIYNQPTTIEYAASDGINTDIQDVHLRNIMVIAADENSDGRVLGTIVNNGSDSATVEIDFETGAKTVTVPAGETIRFEDDAHELIVSPAGANPGMLLEDTKVTVGNDSSTINIPVLDDTIEDYAPYLPNAASADASDEASATPSETAVAE